MLGIKCNTRTLSQYARSPGIDHKHTQRETKTDRATVEGTVEVTGISQVEGRPFQQARLPKVKVQLTVSSRGRGRLTGKAAGQKGIRIRELG